MLAGLVTLCCPLAHFLSLLTLVLAGWPACPFAHPLQWQAQELRVEMQQLKAKNHGLNTQMDALAVDHERLGALLATAEKVMPLLVLVLMAVVVM